jgi:hypothetical protein
MLKPDNNLPYYRNSSSLSEKKLIFFENNLSDFEGFYAIYSEGKIEQKI